MPNSPSPRTLAKQRKAAPFVAVRNHVAAERMAAEAAKAGHIAEHADEWEALLLKGIFSDEAADIMHVSESEAQFYLLLARERVDERERHSTEWRRKPSLSEALLIWGTDGIMRVKSRIKYEREIAIPQFMT